MSMPGFTAEVSLYKTNGRYQMIHAHYQIQGTVSPAQVNRRTKYCVPDTYLPDCSHCQGYDVYGGLVSWDEGGGCNPSCSEWTNCHTEAGCTTCTTQSADCKQVTTTECQTITDPYTSSSFGGFLTR